MPLEEGPKGYRMFKEKEDERFDEARQRRRLVSRLDTLTVREREVLTLLVEGLSSRVIARELGASAKTIDVHRARIKAKSEAESLAALVRDILVLKVPLTPQGEGDQRPD